MTDDTTDQHQGHEWADPDAVWADAATDPVDLDDPALGFGTGAGPGEDRFGAPTAVHASFSDVPDAVHRDELGGAADDEAVEPLVRRPRRTLVTPATAGLAAVVIAAAGFAGGVLVQKGRGATATAPGAPAGLQAMGGAPGAQGRSGGGSTAGAAASGGAASGSASGTGASATSGEVANVKGSTIYIEKSDGTTVRVVAASGATVQRTAKATMSGVHPGDTVTVSGTADEDGTVEATSVTATADGVTAAGGFGGMGGGGMPAMNGGPSGGTGR